jgi:hypothetical protein
LKDIIEHGLFRYLFAEEDANDANFSALILAVEEFLAREKRSGDSSITRDLNPHGPATFKKLLEWVDEQANSDGKKDDPATLNRNHHRLTWKKLYRRLFRLVHESTGVLRRDESEGQPLPIVCADTSDPLIIDLFALATMPDMQRFIVATVFRQLIEARTGANAVQGLVYTITLDELNRFAPRGGRDPIPQLIETVASEMRSQGIILLGAQQQASTVSEKVIDNAAIKALGRTGSLAGLPPAARPVGGGRRQPDAPPS